MGALSVFTAFLAQSDSSLVWKRSHRFSDVLRIALKLKLIECNTL
jgi:hypothetical protein